MYGRRVSPLRWDSRDGSRPGPRLPGLKRPGSLGQTWDKAKSLKFILIDSNFFLSPGGRPPVTLGVSHSLLEIFLRKVKIFFAEHPPGFPRGKGNVGFSLNFSF